MRSFTDKEGREWIAEPREEETPRHFGRWHMTVRPADAPDLVLVLPEARWQNRRSAERTIRDMGEFELRRRLHLAKGRSAVDVDAARDEPFPGDDAPVNT